eukprot:2852029-Rhodomonas_salina.2
MPVQLAVTLPGGKKCANCMPQGQPQKNCTYPHCTNERESYLDSGLCKDHLKVEEEHNIREMHQAGVRVW